MLKITSSWDDGDILDLKLAELLSRYGMKGTFYVAKDYRPKRLSEDDIRTLAKTHEIGAHTLTHPDLRTVSTIKRYQEIKGSKEWLEGLLSTEIKMFCYPKGLHDHAVAEAVKNTGFIGARTTRLGSIKTPSAPYHLETTIQVYPFPFRKLDREKFYLGKLFDPYKDRSPALRRLGVSRLSMYSWLSTARAAFNIAHKHGGVFHLYGHSWEIEKYGMWHELEKLLRYIKEKQTGIHLTNGELVNDRHELI